MADSGNDEKKTVDQKCSDGFAGFKKFLCHKDETTGKKIYMGRTGESWAKIGVFYLFFYGFLAGFFGCMLAVFLSTVNSPGKGAPKLTQFIKNQPGLTRIDSNSDQKLGKKYNSTDKSTYSGYVELVDKFLKNYNKVDHSGKDCIIIPETGIKENEKTCRFNYETLLGNCGNRTSNITDSYGVKEGKPCFFIRINKVYNWIPESDDGQGYLKLDCKGAADVSPPGFLINAFPFRGQKDYQGPVVAVQVDVTREGKRTVECTLKGKGIKVSGSFNPARAYGKIKIEVEDRKTN